jgi:hypothetical protein
MDLVLSKLKKEINKCKVDISHCNHVLKPKGTSYEIRDIYLKSRRKSKKYLIQLETAISILKERE